MFSSKFARARAVPGARLPLLALVLLLSALASCARHDSRPTGPLHAPPRLIVGVNVSSAWMTQYQNGHAADVIAGLQRLRRAGCEALELYLHPMVISWPLLTRLIDESARLGFVFTFHLPFARKHGYNFVGFAGSHRAEFESRFRPLFALAARYAWPGHPVSVVVHGPRSHGSRSELLRDTRAFLTWVGREFPAVRVGLENLPHATRLEKIGTSKRELVSIIAQVDSPRVGLCWDLGHDVLDGTVGADPWGFLAHVNHVHVHDVDGAGHDHEPLIHGRVPLQQMLRRLQRAETRAPEVLVMLEIMWPTSDGRGTGQDQWQLLEESVRKLRRQLGRP